MNLKIKKPNWGEDFGIHCTTNGDLCHKLEEWFMVNVLPINKILGAGDIVEGYKTEDHIQMHEVHGYSPTTDTHRSLLINTQRIKKETAEDVLRKMLEKPGTFVCEWGEEIKSILEDT